MRSSLLLACVLLLFNCEPQMVDDPIPLLPFNDIFINLSFPENTALRTDGGFRALSTGGIRGLLVYRINANQYQVYERNCSYRPNDACANVDVHISGLYMHDSCCNSNFNWTDGTPIGGPAWRPLRRYRTQLSGSLLTITDEPLN
jgi:hypothetical protein